MHALEQAARANNAGPDQQGHHEMRGQEEDMRIADVVAQCKGDRDQISGREQQRPARSHSNQMQKPRDGKERSPGPELLMDVEQVHAHPFDSIGSWDLQDHAAAPVGFRHVEPEGPQPFEEILWWQRRQPEAAKIPEILQRSGDRESQGERNRPRPVTIFRHPSRVTRNRTHAGASRIIVR